MAFIKIQRCCILYIEQTHIRQILLSISLRFYDYKGHHSSKWERKKRMKKKWRHNFITIFEILFVKWEKNKSWKWNVLYVLICIWLYSASDATELMIDEHQMFHKFEVKSDQKSVDLAFFESEYFDVSISIFWTPYSIWVV